MTAIVNLTHAELRKLVASRTFLIGLAISVGLAIISVAVDAAVAGKTGQPALGTVADTNKLLKLGSVCSVAMLVLVAAVSSATGPSAASRPRLMTTTSSTVCAASASRWLDTSTVRPSPASWRSRSRIQRIPSGSRPLSGSSRISTPGSPSKVVASVSR